MVDLIRKIHIILIKPCFKLQRGNSSVVLGKEAWKMKHIQTFTMKEREVSVVIVEHQEVSE